MQKNIHDNLFYQQMLTYTDVGFDTLAKCGIKLSINQEANKFAKAIEINQKNIPPHIEKAFNKLSQKERLNYAVKYMLVLYIDLAKAHIANSDFAIEKALKIIRFRLWQNDMDRETEATVENVCLELQMKTMKNMERLLQSLKENTK